MDERCRDGTGAHLPPLVGAPIFLSRAEMQLWLPLSDPAVPDGIPPLLPPAAPRARVLVSAAAPQQARPLGAASGVDLIPLRFPPVSVL